MGKNDCAVSQSNQAMITLTIDDQEISVSEGTTILQAAEGVGIYIPHICFHPDVPPVDHQQPAGAVYRNEERIENKRPDLRYEGCQLCVVEIEGEKGLHRACSTLVVDAMVVRTVSPQIEAFRSDRIIELAATHPHACLTCAQKNGCARFPCSMNIPEAERCCPLFGTCEFQGVVEYVGLKPETPRYTFEDLPIIHHDSFDGDYNLCIGCTRCIRACRDVCGIGALDFVFDEGGRVMVGTVDTTLQASGCRFCMACVEVCPTGALMEKKLVEGEEPYKKAYPTHRERQGGKKPAVAPKKGPWMDFVAGSLTSVPEMEGVYQLLDEDKTVIYIKGTRDLHQALEEQLAVNAKARYFLYDVDPLYTKRESEVLQQHVARHGEMPEGNRAEVDDLF